MREDVVTVAFRDLTSRSRSGPSSRSCATASAEEPPLTLKVDRCSRMGISRERVRQIECQAKTRLRKLFARKRMIKSPPKRPYPASRVSKPDRINH